jgi:hypothetical protein
MKHTKGEWKACCLDDKPHFIFAGEDKTICSMFYNDPNEPNYESMEGIVTKEECVANAKLIAAAPDLLITLERFNRVTMNLVDSAPTEYKNERNDLFADVHNIHLHVIEIIKKATE